MKAKFTFRSKFFGDLTLMVDSLDDENWISLGDYLDIYIYRHPEDEMLDFNESRWIGTVYPVVDGHTQTIHTIETIWENELTLEEIP